MGSYWVRLCGIRQQLQPRPPRPDLHINCSLAGANSKICPTAVEIPMTQDHFQLSTRSQVQLFHGLLHALINTSGADSSSKEELFRAAGPCAGVLKI